MQISKITCALCTISDYCVVPAKVYSWPWALIKHQSVVLCACMASLINYHWL